MNDAQHLFFWKLYMLRNCEENIVQISKNAEDETSFAKIGVDTVEHE